MQSIQFQNTLEDLRDYYHYWAFSTPEGQKWVRQSHIFGQAVYAVGGLLIWEFSNNIWVALGLWFLFELGLLLRTSFHPGRWLAERSILIWLKPLTGDELENFALPKSLEFSDELLSVRTQEEIHSFGWKRVKRIEKSDNNIFVLCGMRTIFVIPSRAFVSNGDFEMIYEALHSKLNEHSKSKFPRMNDIIG